MLVFASMSSNLGRIQRGDMARDDVRGLDTKVDIVDAQLLIEPFDLVLDLGFRDQTSL